MKEKLKKDIAKYGLSVIMIEHTAYLPSFAYSVGLWETYGHPEIICFGLPLKTLSKLINDAAAMVKDGKEITWSSLSVHPSYISNYFGTAINYYRHDEFPALQLVWPDKQNRFPWDFDYDESYQYLQPLLDRNTDFKFREPKNLGIFTTRQWLELKQPILQVVHDEEGDWQFLTGEEVDEKDVKLVSLQAMIDSDFTLNELFDLDYGESATRNYPGGDWERS